MKRRVPAGFAASITARNAKTALYGQDRYSGRINIGKSAIFNVLNGSLFSHYGHYCFIYRADNDILARWAIKSHNGPFGDPEIAMRIRRR